MEIQAIKQRYGIIGISTGLNRAINIAVQVANTDLSVIIIGESGVGKEVFPKIIHQFSARKHAPYIAINCGAIPEGTIDSELFGHEKGAFTGALSDRKGYFQEVEGGTIFLDEVGELPLSTQSKLLRILETGEFIKIGSSKILKTDVRVIAATNINFDKAIQKGKFREDLYYRLNTIPIEIPPLRKRKEDIFLLFKKFAADFADKYRMPAISITQPAKELIENYYWRGNIRQLKNVTEQMSIIEKNREIDETTLQDYLPNITQVNTPAIYDEENNKEKVFSSEREILYQVLFDMKKDMNDLKKLVFDVIKKGEIDENIQKDNAKLINNLVEYKEGNISSISNANINAPGKIKHRKDKNIEDTKEIMEESLSLDGNEVELIKKALEKNKGKRKFAARELGISERTLYRKIKEYKLNY